LGGGRIRASDLERLDTEYGWPRAMIDGLVGEFGVFTTRAIKEGEELGVYDGREMAVAEAQEEFGTEWWRFSVDANGDGSRVVIGALETPAVYANDGLVTAVNNARLLPYKKGVMRMVAKRAMWKGEQVFWCYGRAYWEHHDDHMKRCNIAPLPWHHVYQDEHNEG
jgi:hypothetical protein